jgi:hypothetical protein
LSTVLLSGDLPLYPLFTFDTAFINTLYHVFLAYLSDYAPSLHARFHINEKDDDDDPHLSCSLFLFEWLVTVFATVFDPLEDLPEVLEYVLVRGEPAMIQVAVGLCRVVEGEYGVVKGQKFEVVMVRIKQIKELVREEGGW